MSNRVQITREDLLKAFNPPKEVPAMMNEEMASTPPLNHILSTYVIRPISYDRDPFVLPKAAVFNK